jgi:regulator of sirC expression with transglutaminase-like and TPR domain
MLKKKGWNEKNGDGMKKMDEEVLTKIQSNLLSIRMHKKQMITAAKSIERLIFDCEDILIKNE